MRFLFVAKRLGWGGMTHSLKDTAAALVRGGHSVGFHTVRGPAVEHHEAALRASGVRVELVDEITRRGLARAIERENAEAVRLFTGTFPPNTTVTRHLFALRVPVVESIHQMSVGRVRVTHRVAYAFFPKRRYRAVVLSRGMLEESARRLPGLKDVFVQLPFGMTVPEAGREPVGDGVFRFCTVTRLDQEHKDTATLIDAMAELARRRRFDGGEEGGGSGGGSGGEWRVTIVGGGPDEEMLKRRAERLGVGGAIEWTGMIDDPVGVMRRSDAFVLATNYEGFGRVNVEAAGVGLPVIASDALGCLDSVDDGVNGIIVPRVDPAAMADAMERVMTDAALRERLAAAGPAHAAKFTSDVHARAFVDLAEVLVRNAGTPSGTRRD